MHNALGLETILLTVDPYYNVFLNKCIYSCQLPSTKMSVMILSLSYHIKGTI